MRDDQRTVPFHFPNDRFPGGREWDFHHNAETFIEIGKAFGEAILELQQK